MAICGKDCTFSIDAAPASEGSTFNIALTREEVDVTPFGGPVMGSWIACRRTGVVTLSSFADEGVEDGDTVDLVATEGSPVVKTQTMAGAICTNFTVNADSQTGAVKYDYTFRLVNYVAS